MRAKDSNFIVEDNKLCMKGISRIKKPDIKAGFLKTPGRKSIAVIVGFVPSWGVEDDPDIVRRSGKRFKSKEYKEGLIRFLNHVEFSNV